MEIEEIKDEVEKNYIRFKKFDIVTDPTDHYYFHQSSRRHRHTPQDTRNRIKTEWKILEKCLPNFILVRVYAEEIHIDLMRVVIVGSGNTPYCYGLFFFDIWFPPDYPSCPPRIYFHSHGLNLNPNLSNDGKVCMSLLKDSWSQRESTLLQVLISIQTFVLCVKPYFNDPDVEHERGTLVGNVNSSRYNNQVFLLSCQAVLRTLDNPPKHFEDFVKGHFRVRAHYILLACKESMSMDGDNNRLGEMVKLLFDAFEENGTYCKHFAYLVNKKHGKVIFKESEEGEIRSKPKHCCLIKTWKKLKMVMGMKKSMKVSSML